MATAGHALTNHNDIRRWADARGAHPACVRGTGRKGDTGMIRIDFPGWSGKESLQEISWQQWFKAFDQNHLALLVQDKTARGQTSNFSKLVSRDTADGSTETRGQKMSGRSREQSGRSKEHMRSASAAHSSTTSARGRTKTAKSAPRKKMGRA
jgi:hypothetical protein